MFAGMFHTGLQMITGGRGLRNRYPAKAGYERMEKLSQLPADGGAEAHLIGPAKGDGKLTFDKLTDLYHSGTKHEEDQPAHLVIHDTNICNDALREGVRQPCQNFCPANVYEMVDDASQPNGKRISLNPSNCVHCKTCDIRTRTRSSRGCRRKAAAGRTTTGCERALRDVSRSDSKSNDSSPSSPSTAKCISSQETLMKSLSSSADNRFSSVLLSSALRLHSRPLLRLDSHNRFCWARSIPRFADRYVHR